MHIYVYTGTNTCTNTYTCIIKLAVGKLLRPVLFRLFVVDLSIRQDLFQVRLTRSVKP